ncbi:MAG: hypothetical protein ACE5GH_05640 [Fidelibacterota bacterium]
MRRIAAMSAGVALVLSNSPAGGESIWVKYGNQVFQGVGDARSVAVSEAEVASATGPLAILWNPARLQAGGENMLVYAHQERFSGNVVFDVIGFNLKDSFKSKWSFALIREGVQGIPNTTDALLHGTGSLESEDERIIASRVTYFNQAQWAAVLGVGRRRGEWNVGGAARILMHRLGDNSGYGIGFDLGVYRSFSPGNSVGVTVRDVTTSWVVWESGTVERIVPQILFGDMQVVPIAPLNLSITLMGTGVLNLSGRTSSDDYSAGSFGGHLRGGIDIQYKENFHLRVGRNPVTRYSAGLGLGFPFGDIDYAFTPSPLGTVLGTSHYISLNLRLSFLKSLKDKLSD